VFKPLSKEDLGKIFDLILKGVNKTLEPQKITMEVDDDAKDFMVEKGYDPKLGARPMRRVVQSYVENILAKAMLAGNLGAGGNLRIDKEMLDGEDEDDD
jgi:ATP-dependent Clp protease ATP-binding subunit ClpA